VPAQAVSSLDRTDSRCWIQQSKTDNEASHKLHMTLQDHSRNARLLIPASLSRLASTRHVVLHWNRARRQGRLLFDERPRLRALQLAEMRPILVESRDGLELHWLLTLPPGSRACAAGRSTRPRPAHADASTGASMLSSRAWPTVATPACRSTSALHRYGRRFLAASSWPWSVRCGKTWSTPSTGPLRRGTESIQAKWRSAARPMAGTPP